MKLLIFNNNQFGYHLDTYYYCVYGERYSSITYICFDFGKPKVDIKNVNVIYVSRSGGYIRRAIRFYRALFKSKKTIAPDFVLVKYFKFCLFTRFITGDKTVLDIRTASVSKKHMVRILEDFLLKIERFFFKYCSVISPDVAGRLNISYDTVLPIGAKCLGKPQSPDKSLGLRMIYIGTFEGRELHRFVDGVGLFKSQGGRLQKLIFIGSGSQADKDKIFESIARCELSTLSEFPGYLSHSELEKYIADANLGVAYVPMVPHYDKQPVTKTLEYLYSGLPVIATATYGNRAVMQEGHGVLTGDSPEDICLGLLDVQSKLSTFRSDAITASVKDFSWEAIAQKLFEFLVSLKDLNS